MTIYDVPEMSCGHCTASIRKAIGTVDPAATVDCDLTARTVSVESALGQDMMVLAMKEAGYEATPVAAG